MVTTAYAALLRGVNVGGRKVPMAELRTLLTDLGLGDVRTYVQSGNVAFTSPAEDDDVLAARMRAAMTERFGFDIDAVVRDHAYLQAVIDACPFPAAELEGRQLHATYFAAPPDPEWFGTLNPPDFHPEDFRLGDRVLYLLAPNGVGRSDLAAALTGCIAKRGVVATSRNWNTVRKMAELTRVAT